MGRLNFEHKWLIALTSTLKGFQCIIKDKVELFILKIHNTKINKENFTNDLHDIELETPKTNSVTKFNFPTKL